MTGLVLFALRRILFISGIFGPFVIVLVFGGLGRNWPDMLLLVWWILFTSLALLSLYLIHRQRAINRAAKAKNADAQEALSFLAPGARFAFYVALVLILPIFIVLFQIRNWTPALHLTIQVLPIAAGSLISIIALTPGPQGLSKHRLIRAILLAFGSVLLFFGWPLAVTASAGAPEVIEGRINRVYTQPRRRGFGDNYFIVIDGFSFPTVRSVYSSAQSGTMVKADVSPQWKMVLRFETLQN